MSNSIADPVITLKLLLDQAAAESVNAVIKASLEKGIQSTEPLLDKIGQYLQTAVTKVDIGSQIRKELESGMKSLKQLGGSDALVKSFDMLEQKAIRFGDAFVQNAARVGRVVAETYVANQRLIAQGTSFNVEASWDASRSADWNRRVHAAMENENRVDYAVEARQRAQTKADALYASDSSPGYSIGGPKDLDKEYDAKRQRILQQHLEDVRQQSVADKYNSLNSGFTPSDIGTNSEGYDLAKRQRIDAYSRQDMEFIASRQRVERFRVLAGDAGAHVVPGNPWESDMLGGVIRRRAEMHSANDMASFQARRDRQAERLARWTQDNPEVDFSVGGPGSNSRYARDLQGQRILTAEQQFSRLNLGDRSQQTGYSRTGHAIGSHTDLMAQRESLIGELQDGYNIRNRPARGGAFNSHNFRFATQNAAFGIDDAIQSYHYGGIAASTRAASNNLTAIAGMGIANPTIAAATVVGLSVATAALPAILKHYGVEKYDYAGGAAAKYQKNTAGYGALARGDSPVDLVADSSKELLDALDARSAHNDDRVAAQKAVGKYSKLNEAFGVGSFMHRRASNFMGAKDAAEFDAAYAFLDDDEKNEPKRRAELQKKIDRLQRNSDPSNLAKLNTVHEFQRSEGFRAYRATSLQEYENSLRASHQAEVEALPANLDPLSRQAKMAVLNMQLEQKLATKEENTRTVRQNVFERTNAQQDSILNSLGFAGGIGGMNVAHSRHLTSIQMDDRLSHTEKFARLGAAVEGHGKLSGRMLEDEVRANKGFNDPLSALAIDFQRKQQDYSDLRNPYTDKQRAALLKSNQEGFDFHRKRIVDGMLGEHEINNGMGFLARDFKKDAEALERRFADAGNNLTADEKLEMEMNLKRDFQLQKRRANTPQGTEQFMANAIDIGSSQDNELRARMLGNFSRPKDDNGWQTQTLEQFRIMVAQLQQLNANLTIAAQGLK